MITLSPEALLAIGRHVVLANTPTYLWRELSRHQTIGYISTTYAPAAVLESLVERLQSPGELTEDDHTTGYALLVALLMRDPNAAVGLAQLPELSRLYFGSRLLALTTARGTSDSRLFIGPQIRFDSDSSIVSSASANTLRVVNS